MCWLIAKVLQCRSWESLGSGAEHCRVLLLLVTRYQFLGFCHCGFSLVHYANCRFCRLRNLRIYNFLLQKRNRKGKVVIVVIVSRESDLLSVLVKVSKPCVSIGCMSSITSEQANTVTANYFRLWHHHKAVGVHPWETVARAQGCRWLVGCLAGHLMKTRQEMFFGKWLTCGMVAIHPRQNV